MTKYGNVISMWPGVGIQVLGHLLQHRAEGIDRNLALVPVQDLDEARHVRALEIVGQVHVHVEIGDGVLLAAGAVLDLDRMADVLDADPVDRNSARCRRGPARPRSADAAGFSAGTARRSCKFGFLVRRNEAEMAPVSHIAMIPDDAKAPGAPAGGPRPP